MCNEINNRAQGAERGEGTQSAEVKKSRGREEIEREERDGTERQPLIKSFILLHYSLSAAFLFASFRRFAPPDKRKENNLN